MASMGRPNPHYLWLAGAIALLAIGPSPGGVESAEPLDGPVLYDRLAHAPVVVLARTLSVGKRAEVQVEERLRGELEHRIILVAYRRENRGRDAHTAPLVFEEGQASLLLLRPDADSRGRPTDPRRFRIVGGAEGKIDLPGEGAPALLQAVRRFVSIQDLDDQHRQWEEIRRLLDEQNLRLAHAGLAKILSFRLVDDQLLPRLLEYLQHPAPVFRRAAIDALGLMVHPPGRMEPSGEVPRILARLKATARADEDPEVRAASLRVLGRLHRADLVDLFREAATRDPAQIVRYEASVALIDLERASGSRTGEDRGGANPHR